MHLDGGSAPDGTSVLSAATVAAMQRRAVDVPDKWTVSADVWGLGWTLYDWFVDRIKTCPRRWNWT